MTSHPLSPGHDPFTDAITASYSLGNSIRAVPIFRGSAVRKYKRLAREEEMKDVGRNSSRRTFGTNVSDIPSSSKRAITTTASTETAQEAQHDKSQNLLTHRNYIDTSVIPHQCMNKSNSVFYRWPAVVRLESDDQLVEWKCILKSNHCHFCRPMGHCENLKDLSDHLNTHHSHFRYKLKIVNDDHVVIRMRLRQPPEPLDHSRYVVNKEGCLLSVKYRRLYPSYCDPPNELHPAFPFSYDKHFLVGATETSLGTTQVAGASKDNYLPVASFEKSNDATRSTSSSVAQIDSGRLASKLEPLSSISMPANGSHPDTSTTANPSSSRSERQKIGSSRDSTAASNKSNAVFHTHQNGAKLLKTGLNLVRSSKGSSHAMPRTSPQRSDSDEKRDAVKRRISPVRTSALSRDAGLSLERQSAANGAGNSTGNKTAGTSASKAKALRRVRKALVNYNHGDYNSGEDESDFANDTFVSARTGRPKKTSTPGRASAHEKRRLLDDYDGLHNARTERMRRAALGAAASQPDSDRPIVITKDVATGNLYHTVTNLPLNVERVNNGYNSDQDPERAEAWWKLRIADDQLSEVVDMLPCEKYFFALWNQFRTIHLGDSRANDREVLPSWLSFVQTFGGEVRRMKMEPLLAATVRCCWEQGTLDADGVLKILDALKKRRIDDVVQGTPVENFEMAKRIIRQANHPLRNACSYDGMDSELSKKLSKDSVDNNTFNWLEKEHSLLYGNDAIYSDDKPLVNEWDDICQSENGALRH